MKTKLLLFLIFLSSVLYAQIPGVTWQQCYNYPIGTNDNYVYNISKTDNGYLLAIDTYEPDLPDYHGSYDILIVSVDTVGNVLWERCYGGSGRDYPQKIIAAGNNEYYVLGKTKSTDGDVQSGNHGSYDFWIFKINSAGDLLWEHTYGSNGADTPRDIMLLPDGGLLLAGEVRSNGGDVSEYYGDWDIWLCRFDSLKNIVWEKTLGNEGEDHVNKILVNNAGNIMLAGSVEEQGGTVTCTPKGMDDVWLTKLDMNGQILWDRCFGGSWDDSGYSLTELEDGYVILATSHSNDGDVSGHHGWSSYSDIWVCKTDTAFNIVWQRSLGGDREEYPSGISVNEEHELTIFGYTFSNNGDVSGNHSVSQTPTSDVWVVSLNGEGNINWQQCYGGVGTEQFPASFKVLNKDDRTFVFVVQTDATMSDDIQCSFYDSKSLWLAEIQECPGYWPTTPEIPSGPDTLCSTVHQQSTYAISPPAHAWTFEWELTPEEAGTVTGQGLTAFVNWQSAFEGTASLRVRGANYCTVSDWSEPKYTQVYTCLGTEETETGNAALQVYPNPAGDYINFELQLEPENTGANISLYNIYGQLVARMPVKKGINTMNTTTLDGGLYIYKLIIGGRVYSGKVVVTANK